MRTLKVISFVAGGVAAVVTFYLTHSIGWVVVVAALDISICATIESSAYNVLDAIQGKH